jgi:hypothetical protein
MLCGIYRDGFVQLSSALRLCSSKSSMARLASAVAGCFVRRASSLSLL